MGTTNLTSHVHERTLQASWKKYELPPRVACIMAQPQLAASWAEFSEVMPCFLLTWADSSVDCIQAAVLQAELVVLSSGNLFGSLSERQVLNLELVEEVVACWHGLCQP